MNGAHKKPRRLTPGAEILEGRRLLNAHLPAAPHVAHHAPAVHAAASHASAATHAPRQITGTLSGLAPYTSTSADGLTGIDTYTTSGKTTSGTATLTGTDSFVSVQKNATTYKDTYYGGNVTLTLGDGSTVAISYVATGQSPVTAGSYSSTVVGKAVGTSGSVLGHVYSFTAKESGTEVDNSVKIKFSLKS